MAVITPDTFNALRQYVGVRLQQGVPLVDADWNELEDARRFELRAFLKWFVGDGVPLGNDGFRIEPIVPPTANDLLISPGLPTGVTPDPLRAVGRCIVDGLDVMIGTPIEFRNQLLHTSKGAAATQLAAKLGLPGPPLPVIAELPNVNGPVTVYLDVWERLVTPAEDTGLVLPGLGTESCARIKREWVVRARAGTTAPAPGEPEFIAKHSYYALAQIARRGAGDVAAADIADQREKRLLLPPATLIEDTLGVAVPDYRRGRGRPAISLRTAINALLRGDLPVTADTPLAPATGIDVIRRGFAFDGSGGVVAIWASTRGGARQIYGSRLSLAAPDSGFGAATLLTPPVAGTAKDEPHFAPLPNGDVLLAYTSGAGTARDVKYKRAPLANLPAAAEQDVAATGGVAERAPVVAVSGNQAMLTYLRSGPDRWLYRRLDHTTGTWIDGAGQELATGAVDASAEVDLHAAVDGGGAVWAAFGTSGNAVRALQFTPSTAARANETTLTTGAGVEAHPFVLCARQSPAAWVFWDNTGHAALPDTVVAARCAGNVWSAPVRVVDGIRPAAVEAPDGGIWLFFHRPRTSGAPNDVYVARLDPASFNVTQTTQVTVPPSDDSNPFALMESPGTAWTFWASDRAAGGTDTDLFYKRLYLAV